MCNMWGLVGSLACQFVAQSVVVWWKISLPRTLFYYISQIFLPPKWLRLDSIKWTLLKMLKWKVEVDLRKRKAASKLAWAPNVLSILEDLLAVTFSEDKADDFTLQQCVWLLLKTISMTDSKNDTSQLSSQLPFAINSENQSTSVSKITARSTILKPNVKGLQRTAMQTQQQRSNFAPAQKHLNNATQHTTNGIQQRKRKGHMAR